MPCRRACPTSACCSCRSASGLAIGAASAVAAFGEDVAGRKFGWRQPASVLSVGAVAVGLFPALLTIGDGAWFMPDTSLVQSVETTARAALGRR